MTSPTPSEEVTALAYVRGDFFPPLPTAYGPWLVELSHRAKEGADPELEMAVPDAIADTGTIPRTAYTADDGTLVITLRDALAALRQTDLLYVQENEDAQGVEMITPSTALALANTADAATWGALYDPGQIEEVADRLRDGRWAIDLDNPIRVDEQGRVRSGLNTLLAMVAADTAAPAPLLYDYDTAARPLTWRGPASGERTPDRD